MKLEAIKPFLQIKGGAVISATANQKYKTDCTSLGFFEFTLYGTLMCLYWWAQHVNLRIDCTKPSGITVFCKLV